MKIIFSKHAEMKIKERKIEREDIEKVLKEPDFVFYDISTQNFINVRKLQKFRRKEGKRWIRVK